MRKFKNLLIAALLISSTAIFAQTKLTGKVVDESNQPLPGATLIVKGTKTGASSDFNGNFTLETTVASGTLQVSFVGYLATSVSFNGNANLGTIMLKPSAESLEEVVITGVVDVAKERYTPVAVSTIKASEIQEKLGSQEFPEILANTPSVYATKGGGGFGDSRINIRGFDQRNTAVLINGVPINDMENGWVYWSNWAGISDVTSAMQVQRGLGSSKLAISSVGGTINVVTKTSSMKEGGSIGSTFGNDAYMKFQASYSTGKMQNGLSASVLLSSTTGDGYVDGTKFEGQNYFIALGYEFNDRHDIQFTFTGAPQWHNQRSFANKIADYIKYGNPEANEPNIKYSSDWGYLNGEEYAWTRNFYHKPVASLNYNFKISEKTTLSSVFYGSWGRGGGTGNIGKSPFSYKTADGLVPFDEFVKFNTGQVNTIGVPLTPSTAAGHVGEYVTDRSKGFTRRSSINSHDWYGAVINLNTALTDNLKLDFGVDARTYVGYHFRNINDRLGADVYYDNVNVNNKPAGRYLYETYSASPSLNPFTNVKDQEKIEYNSNGYVRWLGAFTQLEYATEKLSAFIQGAVSQQGFKREDTFTYLESDPLYETDFENILGGNIKGGVNYNIDESNNVFVNSGFYSKQPNFSAVYPNNKSIVNENLTNEKVFGLEAGYGFRSSIFSANLNVYYTSWKDRYQRSNDSGADNVGGYFDFAGITEIHSGVELEVSAKPIPQLSLNGMVSIGDWNYDGNVTSNRYDANNTQIGTGSTLYLDKVKVGDAAQITASLGARYEIITGLNIDANYRVADKLYASIDPARFSSETNKGSLELPSYGLMDAGISYKMLLGADKSKSLNFRLNVNNVLDEVYISESRTNIFADDNVSSSNPALGTYASNDRLYNGVANANQVYFGYGRTWNFAVKYSF
ncbi:MAG: TonB-dependent receptor [Lutibacter sp.]